MRVYSVHARPGDRDTSGDDGAIFVPEAFSWGAYLWGPLWLVRKRAWLALLVWIVAMGALALATWQARTPLEIAAPLAELGAIFLGLEGNRIWAGALAARGYTLVDVVRADNVEAAERRYFRRAAAPAPASVMRPPPPPSRDYHVGSLFPEAGG